MDNNLSLLATFKNHTCCKDHKLSDFDDEMLFQKSHFFYCKTLNILFINDTFVHAHHFELPACNVLDNECHCSRSANIMRCVVEL